MSEIVVSEVQIIPVKPREGLVAFASCVINGHFYLGGLAIYTCLSSSEGFRVTYPTKVLNNGTKLDLVYPITREVGLTVQKKIVEKYVKLIEDLTKGNGKNEQEPRFT
ncbi:MAG: septation protein SpoVG family protein [Candidatus Omnitrophica bacterium]|nr:septation protein SpoVG family protein [Candidatus Omnitrophota bacterium]MDD5592257.1 septation protein SpoVG family protein [Candidatus Omnitrophota bacterium]